MSIRVKLHHVTSYRYERAIQLGPQVVRLRPAPHCRTQIVSYAQRVTPDTHYINWQQDPFGNYQARLVFPEKTKSFKIEVDLVADMTVINPFDFFLEPEAEGFPFRYDKDLRRELGPYLEVDAPTPRLRAFVASLPGSSERVVDYLVEVNQRLQKMIGYTIRMEPGVQSPEETLAKGSGSCRDSAWLMATALRHVGLATRFVSGYLVQLAPDQKPLDGPAGPEQDFTDLHAWTEVFLPGAGWVGLDPTSGLLAGEGHIPLAATPDPVGAAPITGKLESCETEFDFGMSLERVHESPRVTKPYTEEQWSAIESLGHRIDERLRADDVRLTMGGEPTFVSIDDMDGAEWITGAVGVAKQRLSAELVLKLKDRFAPGGFLHYGQGKWYPGESLPRWAYGCYWRKDGKPVWHNPKLMSSPDRDDGLGVVDAQRFAMTLASVIGVSDAFVTPAYEDAMFYAWKEHRLPPNVEAGDSRAKTDEDRRRMGRIFEEGLDRPVGYLMPLQQPWWQSGGGRWATGPWPVRSEHLFLIPGDSPMGLRLPLDALHHLPKKEQPFAAPADPTMERPALREPRLQALQERARALAERRGVGRNGGGRGAGYEEGDVGDGVTALESGLELDLLFDEAPMVAEAPHIVRTALCVEARGGRVHVFMPPVDDLESYLDLVAAVEFTAGHLEMPVVLEGYLPPTDARLNVLKVTPDPGVIEVNVHPANGWDELVETTTKLYEDARQTRLGTEKFDLDGKHTGTGGGNHFVLGAAAPLDSPFLRRHDLLSSLLTYWQNHPSLSYFFSSRFVGPTSQAPRVDEGRADALYELELAIDTLNRSEGGAPPWLVDRAFRHLLTDLTGNTHRAEVCIDKLYSPDSVTGRLGLVELRGFEMPPHARMSLTQQLLIRALIAHLWRHPYQQGLIPWDTTLHDRFMMPHFLWEDLLDVLKDLRGDGMDLDPSWFATHLEFRFPRIGSFLHRSMRVQLRHAIEPWYVLGEEASGGGTARAVDSSLERIEVKVDGLVAQRYALLCGGRPLPLHPTGTQGQYVAAVRYRAWQPPSCLHPTIPVHAPLVFDVVERASGQSVDGCTYHVSNPSGRNPETFPVNASEAEARRSARFFAHTHTPGKLELVGESLNPDYPMTLDLRRPARPGF